VTLSDHGDALSARAPRVGVWARSDSDRFGDALRARILERELGRRLPDAVVRPFAPLGALGASRFDDGRAAEPLGIPTPRRLQELAEELDLVILCGPELPEDPSSGSLLEGLGPELERSCPTVAFGVRVPADLDEAEAAGVRAALGGRRWTAVADEPSRRRLAAADVVGEIEIIPDPVLLTARAIAPDALRRRRDQLRATGRLPASGRPVVIAGGPGLLAGSCEVGRAVRGVLGADRARACLLVGTGSPADEARLADTALAYLPRGTMRLGPDAGTDLTVAAIAEAAVLVTDDQAAALVARAYGVPHLVPGEARSADALEAAIRQAIAEPGAGEAAGDDGVARLDGALDRLAEDARRAAVIRSRAPVPAADASDRLELVRSAGEARARRLMGELARERERSAALEAAIEEQAPMLDHVQAAYESLRTHVQVAQLRAEQAEARLAAAQLASAEALAATQANTNHQLGALQAQINHFAATVEAQAAQIAQLASERDAALSAGAGHAERAEAARARAEALAAELEGVRRTLETIVSSRSWRALAPARSAGEVMRRLSQ
jgi:hypothetical protein